MIKKEITGIGPVSFRKITINSIADAQDSAGQLELPEKAQVFTNHLVAGAIVEPVMTPGEIKQLPANTMLELVQSIVELLNMEQQYCAVNSDDLYLQFYSAFREYESTLFSGFIKKLKPIMDASNIQALGYPGNLSNFIAMLKETSDQMRALFETLQTNINLATTVSSSIAKAFKHFNFAGVFKEFKIQIRQQKEAVDAFRVAGWAIAPSMPVSLIEQVVNMHNGGNIRYVSRTIMGYYNRNNHINLKNAVAAWSSNPYFTPRMKIIKDALWAHCEGLYTLSYPAIVPQIEGILRSYVHTNELIKNSNKLRLAEICEMATDDYDLSNWLIATALLYQLENNIYTFKDFEKELNKSDSSRSITRHTTLHGIAYNYDRQIHSLKAFILLDAVSGLPVKIDKLVSI